MQNIHLFPFGIGGVFPRTALSSQGFQKQEILQMQSYRQHILICKY